MKRPLTTSPAWTTEQEDQLRAAAESGEAYCRDFDASVPQRGRLRHKARALGIVLRRVEKTTRPRS